MFAHNPKKYTEKISTTNKRGNIKAAGNKINVQKSTFSIY